MGDGQRTDQFLVTASCDGVAIGTWDKQSGFDADSNEVKYRAGGGGKQKSLGGAGTTSDGTLQRNYDPDRDDPVLDLLLPRRGKGRMVVTVQPLDDNDNPYGKPRTYTGKLKTVKTPDADSEAATAGLISITVGADETIN